MKFFAVTIAALAGVAFAAPTDNDKCQPGTYQCSANYWDGKPGWSVCNTAGSWVRGGDCPPLSECKFNDQNGSPYCVPAGFHFN
ncbi:hypothetical protein E4U59_003963 [Claviceps monticola]|nr:hypothetical protein E4U59_003963 [Claviceps monticola]